MQNFFQPEKLFNFNNKPLDNKAPLSLIATSIAHIAENNTHVTSVYFDNQRLSNDNVINLCSALPMNTNLKLINLAMTNLNLQQLTLILHAIKLNKSITTVILPLANDHPEDFKLLVAETQEHVARNKTDLKSVKLR